MRTRSRRIKRQNSDGFFNFREDNFMIDPISLIFFGIFILVYLTLLDRTFEEDDMYTSFYIQLFLVMAIFGLVFGLIISMFNQYLLKKPISNVWFDVRTMFSDTSGKIKISDTFINNSAIYVLIFMGGFVGIGITQYIVGSTISLTNLELYLFYSFASIPEEFFYRFFFTTIIYVTIKNTINMFAQRGEKLGIIHNKTIVNVVTIVISSITSIIGTSFFFMMSHFGRYGDMMNIMIGVFASSIILTVIYVISKNILICILIHLLTNMIVFGSFLVMA